MRQRRRSRLSHDGEDDDPMSVVSNLFDVAMVFALALMVALVSRYNMTEMFSKDNFTMVKNPGLVEKQAGFCSSSKGQR